MRWADVNAREEEKLNEVEAEEQQEVEAVEELQEVEAEEDQQEVEAEEEQEEEAGEQQLPQQRQQHAPVFVPMRRPSSRGAGLALQVLLIHACVHQIIVCLILLPPCCMRR